MPSIQTLKKAAARNCKKGRKGEVSGNQAIVEALREYALAHNVVGAEFNFDAVLLGRAGKRTFWSPFLVQIDGKPYLPYFDPRRDGPRQRRANSSFQSTTPTSESKIRRSMAASVAEKLSGHFGAPDQALGRGQSCTWPRTHSRQALDTSLSCRYASVHGSDRQNASIYLTGLPRKGCSALSSFPLEPLP
jgi:hypothetical protein